MTVRTGALVAALALAVGGTAHAGPRVSDPERRWAVGTAGLDRARDVARQRWGGEPCGGMVTVAWRPQDPSINATASWSNPEAAYGVPERNADCVLALNPLASFDWEKLCTIVLHEHGHFAGHDHDPQPGRLMSPVYTDPDPVCETTPEPPAPRGAAPLPRSTAGASASIDKPRISATKTRRRVIRIRRRATKPTERARHTRHRSSHRSVARPAHAAGSVSTAPLLALPALLARPLPVLGGQARSLGARDPAAG